MIETCRGARSAARRGTRARRRALEASRVAATLKPSRDSDIRIEVWLCSFVVGHSQKLIDYAYRANHEMTVKAKAIVAARERR